MQAIKKSKIALVIAILGIPFANLVSMQKVNAEINYDSVEVNKNNIESNNNDIAIEKEAWTQSRRETFFK